MAARYAAAAEEAGVDVGGVGRPVRRFSLGVSAVGAVVLIVLAVVHSGRSDSSVLQSVDPASISAEVESVLKQSQERDAANRASAHSQELAAHDLKKGAWRGISDQVVREFDHVFSPQHKKKAGGLKPTLAGRQKVKGAKHETEKGNFLLKMGLVSKGGYVRVWVPDKPAHKVGGTAAVSSSAAASSEKASRPGTIARAAAQHGEEVPDLLKKEAALGKNKEPAARQTALQQKTVAANDKSIGCNPGLELGCHVDANSLSTSGKTAHGPHMARIVQARKTGEAEKAAANIAAAVHAEMQLASKWKDNEGAPQPVLPNDAVAQTREAHHETA